MVLSRRCCHTASLLLLEVSLACYKKRVLISLPCLLSVPVLALTLSVQHASYVLPTIVHAIGHKAALGSIVLPV